jgi:hypothetical protein
MVLSYSFLWSREDDRGETSGRKDRPAAIVIIRSDLGPGKLVYVVPITHSEPAEGDTSKVQLPRQIKERLGLDETRALLSKIEISVADARMTDDPSETLARIAQSHPARPLPLEAEDQKRA